MSREVSAAEKREVRVCPECGAAAVRLSEKLHTFEYGASDSVELSALLPMWTCDACGFGYVDARGMEIKHEAICRHLGVLTPREIRQLRDRHDLSRDALARLTRFGEASIKRWERGALIQNASADRFLRLLDHDYVLRRLRNIDGELSREAEQVEPSRVEVAQPTKSTVPLRGFVRSTFGAIERAKQTVRDAADAVFQTPATALAHDGSTLTEDVSVSAEPEETSFVPQELGSAETEQGEIIFLDAGAGKTHVRLSPATSPRTLLLGGNEYSLVELNQDAGEFLVEGLDAGDADMFIVARDRVPEKHQISWR